MLNVVKNSQIVHVRQGVRTVASGLLNPSSNAKTGDMLQISHFVDDIKPTQALKEKQDHKVCGDCPLKGKVCYVNLVSYNASWQATNGQAPMDDFPKVKKPVRFGAYGDTVLSLPIDLVRKWTSWLKANKLKWTGYTHQWHKAPTTWSRYLMASIDHQSAEREGLSVLDLKAAANKSGYRTFRVLKDGEPLASDEILCPNYTNGVQCRDCGLCNGSTSTTDHRKNIAIYVHGPSNKTKTYNK